MSISQSSISYIDIYRYTVCWFYHFIFANIHFHNEFILNHNNHYQQTSFDTLLSLSLSPTSSAFQSHVQLGFATDRPLSKFKHVRCEVKEPFDEVLYMYIDWTAVGQTRCGARSWWYAKANLWPKAMAIKVRPQGRSRGGKEGRQRLRDWCRTDEWSATERFRHGHGTWTWTRMSVVARTNISVKSMRRRKVCKAGVRSSGGEEGEKTNVLAGELWPTGEGCSHETLQTAKVERE